MIFTSGRGTRPASRRKVSQLTTRPSQPIAAAAPVKTSNATSREVFASPATLAATKTIRSVPTEARLPNSQIFARLTRRSYAANQRSAVSPPHAPEVAAECFFTGHSEYYLWQVRKGEKRLHARFWTR